MERPRIRRCGECRGKGRLATILAQTTDQGDEGDLVSGIGSEIEVGFDRWSAGQIGLSNFVAAAVVVGGPAALADPEVIVRPPEPADLPGEAG